MAHNLPEQRLVGNKIELRTPDKKHVVYYPQQLAAIAIHQKRYSVFQISDESGITHIVALQNDGAHFRVGGLSKNIIKVYEDIPWPEQSIRDSNGAFFYKVAPSLSALKAYFEALKQ